MAILDEKKLTQQDVDSINEVMKQAEYSTLKKAIAKLLGDNADKEMVEKKFQAIRKKLSRNSETNLYEFKNGKSVKAQNSKPKQQTEEQQVQKAEEKVAKKEEVKKETSIVTSKKPRKTKKEIEAERLKAEREENIKINPLRLFSRTGHEITDKLFYSSKDECAGTGVYLLPTIVKEFSAVEEAFNHIYNYRLVDAAIQLTHSYNCYLMESNVFMDFMKTLNKDKLTLKHEETRRKEIMAEYNRRLEEYKQRKENGEEVGEEPKEPKFAPLKKQLNLKLSQTAISDLDTLCNQFSMFTKSEVINLCMFALSESAKTTFLKEEKED